MVKRKVDWENVKIILIILMGVLLSPILLIIALIYGIYDTIKSAFYEMFDFIYPEVYEDTEERND